MQTFKEWLIAYHGTGGDISAFSLEFVGEGEGVNKYGYGLYFTSDEEIARYYADRSGDNGKVYEVELFKTKPNLLKWDETIDFNDVVRMSKAINGKELIEQIYEETKPGYSIDSFHHAFQRVLFNQNDEDAWDILKESDEEYDWSKLENTVSKAGFEFDTYDNNESLYG